MSESQSSLTQNVRDEIIVHKWTCQSSNLIPSQVLHEGRNIVISATGDEGWSQPRQSTILQIAEAPRNAYAYSKRPPAIRIARLDSVVPKEILKEWNSEPDVSELFSLIDLAGFESTGLGSIIQTIHDRPHPDGTRQDEILSPRVKRRKREIQTAYTSESEEQRPRKRPRLDTGSLYHVIPQPHFLPSPAPASTSADSEFVLDPTAFYAVLDVSPVEDYTHEIIKAYLGDPYARGAWIIPVRRAPPWSGCTAASILDSSLPHDQSSANSSDALLPSRPERAANDPASSSDEEITWTHDALLDFWSFLVSVRDARTLGPLALSFHAAGSKPRTQTVSSAVPIAGHAAETASSGHETQLSVSAQLLSADYIKVYHDVRYAMQVRNVLHAWSYKPLSEAHRSDEVTKLTIPATDDQTTLAGIRKTSAARSGGDVVQLRGKRIRVLKGARLALVDELSRGVLTC